MMFASHMRTFDAGRQGIRFYGYDGTMQWPFFVTAEALRRVHPSMAQSEAGMLEAFDSNSDRICALAAKLYTWEYGDSSGCRIVEI